jgi:radical SAM protein with 4Fe4S-binding SPASM domain
MAVSKGLTVSLATNGTLIDQATAEWITGSRVRRVSISIDGADGDTHDGFRSQPGSFDRALQGFRELKRLGMSMQIIYRLANTLKADALHLFMLVPVGCGARLDSMMLSAQEYEGVLSWVSERAKLGEIYLRPTCAPHYFRIAQGTPGQNGLDAMTKGCLAGSAICFISHRGHVYPCGYLPLSAGDIRVQRLRDIWYSSPIFVQLRRPDLLEGKCGVCGFRWVCSGCRAQAYSYTGNPMAEEPFCTYQP